eukprot:316892-Rhodomonas_salina.2
MGSGDRAVIHNGRWKVEEETSPGIERGAGEHTVAVTQPNESEEAWPQSFALPNAAIKLTLMFQLQWIREVFEYFDRDGNGGIDVSTVLLRTTFSWAIPSETGADVVVMRSLRS